jgi:hypothetical protein
MITDKAFNKVVENINNAEMLNVLAQHFKLTCFNNDIMSRFIEMCLCNNEEINKTFIKTKHDFDNIKLIEAIDKRYSEQCIASITDIINIDYLTGNITVVYNYYHVSYHINEDFSDDGISYKDDKHKYAKIDTSYCYSGNVILNYYNQDLM